MKLISKLKKVLLFGVLLSVANSSFVFADWVKENNRFKYYNSSTNQYVVNNWLQTGNGFYYFDQYGFAVTGWYVINGKYYYFNQDGLMQVGFQELNDKKYYFDPNNGQMVTGWVQTYTNGVVDYYYYDADGAQVIGWKQIANKWYYFYNGACLVDTFAEINNSWYHFNTAGSMDTGWITANGKMYYFNLSNGSMLKGWIQDQAGNEYYLSEYDGSLAVNTTINVAGRNYTFDETGKCIAKDQYTYAGDINGNTAALNSGVLGYKGTATVYGVNIGVEPGSYATSGAMTSVQQQIKASEPLQPGETAGPR